MLQKLLADREGALAQDAAMTSALVQLSSQVCSSMSELAAMLADAISASLPDAEDSGAALLGPTSAQPHHSCLALKSAAMILFHLHDLIA